MTRGTFLVALAWLMLTDACWQQPEASAAPPSDGPATPLVALVDIDRSAVGPLLQTALSVDQRLAWVERDKLEAALQEQMLAETFSAAAGPSRVKLGGLLSADILVLLRESDRPNPSDPKQTIKQLDMVVAETSRGLRLAMESLPASADPQVDADRLKKVVDRALKKHRERDAFACAVPPFVSKDLFFEFDYLKAGLSKAIEGSLLDRPGMVVVELAEAEALGKENALASQAGPERSQPCYLLGEYRNDGRTPNRRVSVRLRLMRGNTEIASQHTDQLPPNDVVAFCVSTSQKLLAEIDGRQPVVDSTGEADILIERARLLMRLGSWDEAMPLVEAALLLSPGRIDILADAVVISSRLGERFVKNAKNVAIALPALRQYRRGLDHVEAFVERVPKLKAYESVGHLNIVDSYPVYHFNRARGTPEIKPAYKEVLNAQRQMLMRMVPLRAKILSEDATVNAGDGSMTEFTVTMPKELKEKLGPKAYVETIGSSGEINDYRLLWLAMDQLPNQVRFDTIFNMMEQLHSLPGARPRAYRMARGPYQLVPNLDSAEARTFLSRLKNDSRPEFREAGERIAKQVADNTAPPVALIGEPQLPPAAVKLVTRPIQLLVQQPNGKYVRLPYLAGCEPLGPNEDLLWSGNHVFLMTEKGHPRRVYSADHEQNLIKYASYDGQYLWFAVQGVKDEAPWLVVIDPRTEKIWLVTAEHGLPVVAPEDAVRQGPPQSLAVVGVAPGRACVAGSFGHSWVAMVDFDPLSGPKVQKFHEALIEPNPLNPNQSLGIDVAFSPSYMYLLDRGQSGHGMRVLIGRDMGNNDAMHPLLVDIDKLQIQALTDPMRLEDSFRNHAVIQAGSAHFLEFFVHGDGLKEIRLCRVSPPAFQREPLLHAVPQGQLLIEGGDVHIVGKKWWTGSLSAGNLTLVSDSLPWYYQHQWRYPGQTEENYEQFSNHNSRPDRRGIYRSAHYGYLVVLGGEPGLMAAHLQPR